MWRIYSRYFEKILEKLKKNNEETVKPAIHYSQTTAK